MTCHFNTKFPVLDSCFRVNFNTRVMYSMPVLPEHAINFNQILTILLRRSRILVLLRSTNQSPLPLSLSTLLHHKLLLRTQILVSIFVRTMMQCFVLHVFRHTLFFLYLRTSTLLQLWNLNSLHAELPERGPGKHKTSTMMPWHGRKIQTEDVCEKVFAESKRFCETPAQYSMIMAKLLGQLSFHSTIIFAVYA